MVLASPALIGAPAPPSLARRRQGRREAERRSQPAEAGGLDVSRDRRRRHHLIEGGPLFMHLTAQIERRGSQHHLQLIALLPAHDFGSGASSSVRYCGASAAALAINAAVPASSSGGGASVRLATGTPTA
jgi:hypothetical protein